jgi:hypothetical protein
MKFKAGHWLLEHLRFVVPVIIFGSAMWQRYVLGHRESAVAQELKASRELYLPLYWLGLAIPFLAFGIAVYIINGKPTHIGLWYLLAAGLLDVALMIRRALRYRFPHPG